MTILHGPRVFGLAFMVVGATACASTPEPTSAPQRVSVDALLPDEVDDLRLATCVADRIREANERYVNRRARARVAAYRQSVDRATLAEAMSMAAAQASVNALDATRQAANDPGYSDEAARANSRAVRIRAAELRAASRGVSVDRPDLPAEATVMVRAAARAASAIRGSLSAANRYAELSSLHAEAFAAALAAERGEATVAEAELAAVRLSRAVAEWPDGEVLYRTNFAEVRRVAPAQCER